jgi:hypothetical protein
MVSRINIEIPVYGDPTTESVRENFRIAQEEITELQSRTSSIYDVPQMPAGEKWIRQRGRWLIHRYHNDVDGGVF